MLEVIRSVPRLPLWPGEASFAERERGMLFRGSRADVGEMTGQEEAFSGEEGARPEPGGRREAGPPLPGGWVGDRGVEGG